MQAEPFSPVGGTTGSPLVQPYVKYHSFDELVPAGTRDMVVLLSGII